MADVLVVEDTADLRGLLEVRLRKEGHRVLSASSGEEALTLLAGRKAPDVIVLDVVMPGMSGLELHAALGRDPALAQVPVIFLSSRIQPGDIEAGRELGATYLTKPVVISALFGAIQKALQVAPTEGDTW